MHDSATRFLGGLTGAVVLAGSLTIGGCPQPSYESLLPAVWPDGLKEVYDQRERFDQPEGGPPNIDLTWPAVDDVSSLVGCWGSYYPDIAASDEPVRIDDYSVLTLREDGTFTWSHLDNFGDLIPHVFTAVGVYELLDGRRLRLTESDLIDYNPVSQAYESFTEDGLMSLDYLVTLDGDTLLVEGIAGDETPGDAGVDRTIALYALDCN